ncbi:helix-turn-helix transcriptional regulator [uncultured Pseudoflavonifractor sp.]|uniref:helix-turn-helix domain-containing protein n=1 Tax=uncultured Pseudoflavonifractor sp. TaxID=1221379 RepID=UPI0025D11558|nr:helix-turn-helix transcriptional regulator [uncultured Pseudoflavonifractor sp.]
MELNERIAAARRAAGMSQEQLGEALGVSRQAVSKWESGQTKPDLEAVSKMCELFHLSADYLLLGKEGNKTDSAPTQAQAKPHQQSNITFDYALVLMDINPAPQETKNTLRRLGMTEEEIEQAIPVLPVVLASGLSLEEAYRRAQEFRECGLVKVVRDGDTRTRESMLRADPIEAPQEKRGGLGFGGTVLAVMLGVVLALLLMALF